MKKFYGACVALLMSLLFVFAGCKADGGKVMEFLKTTKAFEGTEYRNNPYRVTLTVGEDLSYSLSVSYGSGVFQNYQTEGSELEYLGYEEQEFTSGWLGITQSNIAYNHVVRLNGATIDEDGKSYAFYLVANATSKRSDSFSLSLKAYSKNPSAADMPDESNLSAIINSSITFTIRAK